MAFTKPSTAKTDASTVTSTPNARAAAEAIRNDGDRLYAGHSLCAGISP
jgi:hypothetical protein